MNKHIKTNKILNQAGQALLFVVVAMTLALTVGVAISSQTISSLKRTSSTNSESRVFLAAEGGIEWFLRQSVSVLENLSDGNTDNGADCPLGTAGDSINPAVCVITYQPQDNDKIQSETLITVNKFSVNYTTSPNEHYWFIVNPGAVKETALTDYKTNSFYTGDIDICWKSLEPSQSSALYYYTYDMEGIKEKELVSPNTVVGSLNLSGSVTAGPGKLDYTSCHSVSISSGTLGLRIKSLYVPSKIGIFPLDSGFPPQGYKISSLGQISNVAQKNMTSKEINVYRSFPYAASVFDYAIYSNGVID